MNPIKQESGIGPVSDQFIHDSAKLAFDYQLAVGRPPPQPPSHPKGVAPANVGPGLQVFISHEFFTDTLVLAWEGQSEELTHVEALAWFNERGARNTEKLNEAINCALNFGKAVFTISNPIRVSHQVDSIDPRI